MPHLQVIRAESLLIDPDVQVVFAVNEKQWRTIAAHFNPELLGVLVVVPGGKDTYLIIDGRHRFLAGVSRGVKEWRCDVHSNATTVAEKAKLKLGYDRQRRRITALEHFIVRAKSGESGPVEIQRVVSHSMFEIGKCSYGGVPYHRIEAVVALERAYNQLGSEGLGRTLELATIWGGDPKSNVSDWIGGLSLLVRDGYDEAITNGARERLRELIPASELRRAKGEVIAGGNGNTESVSAVSYALATRLRKVARLKQRPVVQAPKGVHARAI